MLPPPLREGVPRRGEDSMDELRARPLFALLFGRTQMAVHAPVIHKLISKVLESHKLSNGAGLVIENSGPQ